jgi:transposase InsO family protein
VVDVLALTCWLHKDAILAALDRGDHRRERRRRRLRATTLGESLRIGQSRFVASEGRILDAGEFIGAVVTRRLRAMGIRDEPTAPASPWQNGFAERLIGSIRRECLDHIIVLGEAHLRRILK